LLKTDVRHGEAIRKGWASARGKKLRSRENSVGEGWVSAAHLRSAGKGKRRKSPRGPGDEETQHGGGGKERFPSERKGS